jgi:molecular chaperone HtpG
VLTPLSPDDNPVSVTRPEFMRRMKEMSSYNGMDFAASMPDQYNLVINTNHPVMSNVLSVEDEKEKESRIKQLHDLALLSQGMLKGNDLSTFVKRSFGMLTA